MPHELKVHVLAFLRPKELVRASRVSKEFHNMCFDGQLWTSLDASEFYSDIPAESLAKIIVSAGPFVKDLNLRGCLQVEHYQRAEVVVKACRNLINATLEGCRNFKRSTLHSLLKANDKLAHLNLTGLAAVNNTTCKIVAESCPQLEVFNVSWCKHMDARGLKYIIDACPKLTDLRAGEIKGFSNLDVATSLFHTNTLHRLVLAGCDDLTDAALKTILHGPDPEIDILTNLPIVPPRKLRHLDLSRCTRLTSTGIQALAHLVPHLQGLQLSGVTHLTDAGLEPVLATVPRLSHLEMEDCAELSNALLAHHLAKAPCAGTLEHLSVSYCANLSDAGVLPVVRACTALRTVYLDNTRVSDLVLAEAAGVVRERVGKGAGRRGSLGRGPVVSLNMVVYDCPNVTWTGVREVLSRNADVPVVRGEGKGKGKERVVEVEVEEAEEGGDGEGGGRPRNITTTTSSATAPPAPAEIIGLKCFYGWQMTVDEHTKRVLRGDFAAARRLERKWADYMQANEEAGTVGAGIRRRRRRAREALMVHNEEEGGGDGAGEGGGATVGGRRRARTTVCVVM
jgi:F-box/leucine-rich repeat protein 2/20